MKKPKLTVKQKKFADEYIKTGNATQSAISAGYSKNTAQQTGSENLLKPVIKQYIDAKMQKIEDNKIMGAQEALEQLSKIARGEPFIKMISLDENNEPKPDLVVPKPADMLNAIKEILKRYPLSELDKAQIKKAQAEAIKAEAEAQVAKAQAQQLHTIEDKTREKMDKMSTDDLRKLARLTGDDNSD